MSPGDVEYFNSKLPTIDDQPGAECYMPPEPANYFQTYAPQPPAAFAYDTAMAIGLGACRAYNDNNDNDHPALDGHAHDAEIVQNTNFEGATGLVHIDNASRNPLTFAYVVLNAVISNGNINDSPGSSSGRIAFDAPESILFKPNDEGTDWILVEQQPFIFPDGTATPPPDLTPIVEDMNYIGKLSILAYILFSIVAILSSYCSYWAWSNRRKRVVRASQVRTV